MYKDGVEVPLENNGSQSADGLLYNALPRDIARTKNYIGRSSWGDPEFDVSIQFIRLYDRALTAEEVAENVEFTDSTPQEHEIASSTGSGTSPLADTGFDMLPVTVTGLLALAFGTAVRRRARSA